MLHTVTCEFENAVKIISPSKDCGIFGEGGGIQMISLQGAEHRGGSGEPPPDNFVK